jgi:aromatic ring-opening dioxygenase LigB subunit
MPYINFKSVGLKVESIFEAELALEVVCIDFKTGRRSRVSVQFGAEIPILTIHVFARIYFPEK